MSKAGIVFFRLSVTLNKTAMREALDLNISKKNIIYNLWDGYFTIKCCQSDYRLLFLIFLLLEFSKRFKGRNSYNSIIHFVKLQHQIHCCRPIQRT